ncbi:MAG TPA: hypothetical protein DDZ76_06430 [Xanthomonadales bacterium]|nr:hypothetical protein [Xanthomonadales bacterium]
MNSIAYRLQYVSTRRPVGIPAALSLAILLAGCAAVPDGPHPRERLNEAVAVALGAPIAEAIDAPDTAHREARIAELLASPLDRDAALELAALADHEIAALVIELDGQRAMTESAGLPANPSFRLMAMRMEAGRVPGVTMLDYGLMQDLVSLLDRDRRLAEAEAEERVRTFMSATRVLERLWSVESAHGLAVAARERTRLWRQRAEQAELAGRLAHDLVARGVLRQIDALPRWADSADRMQRAQQAEDQALALTAALAEALGLASAQGIRLPDALPAPTPDTRDAAGLRAAAVGLRLDLLAAQSAADRDRQALALIERWRLLPRLGLGLAGEREADGVGALGAELAVTVPIFDTGRQRLDAARARVQASDARIEAHRRRVQAAVDRAWSEWRIHDRRLAELQTRVRPELATRLALVEHGYRDGLFDRFTVIDAIDALLALDLDILDASQARLLARIELARQVGSASAGSAIAPDDAAPTEARSP